MQISDFLVNQYKKLLYLQNHKSFQIIWQIHEKIIPYQKWWINLLGNMTNEFQSESTLYSLPECQGTPCLKQVPYLKFKWQQRD